MKLGDVAVPGPDAGDLLSQVAASSIESGDLLNRRNLSSGPDRSIGHLAAGDVMEVRASIARFAVGQMVTSFA